MTDVASAGRARRTEDASFPSDEPCASIDPRVARQAADARRDAHVTTAPSPTSTPVAATRPRSLAALAKEVLARKAEVASGGGPASVRALADARSAWCNEASRRGLAPASESFVPAAASDEQLRAAILWTEIGGALPPHAFADGGTSFRAELQLAALARSPLALRVAPDSPELHAACHRELARLGEDRAPDGNDTVAGLADRIALARQTVAAKEEAAAPRIVIGASGRVGSEEVVAAADFEAYLAAMAPGTATGAILAASHAGDLGAMQKSGALGNALEDTAGPFARGKHNDHPLVGRAANSHRP